MNRDSDGTRVNERGWPAAERWSSELEAYSDGQRQLEKARARLLNPSAGGVRGPAWRLRPIVLWALGLAPLLGVAALVLTQADPPVAPSFTVRAEASSRSQLGKPGETFSSVIGQESVLSFWEGSQVRLLGGAQAKVAELSGHGARLQLVEGEAEVHITHSPDSTWAVDVGAFRVAVLGTHFFVSKLATGPGLQIRLIEGKVAISGPCLDAPIRVGAGEQRVVDCQRATEVAAAPTTAPASPIVAVPSSAHSAPAPERLGLESTPPKSPSALRQEVELMESIRAALTVDPARALALIHDAAARFPQGSLSEERQAFEALALDGLGRTREARARAESFLRRYPNGSFSARMRGLVSKAKR